MVASDHLRNVSVIICCANSEHTLGHAIESVRWADEVVVVDSGSRDRTAEVAQRYDFVRYVQEPWRGHVGQKRFATELCRHDWVFIVDGDEECSPRLAAEIAAIPDDEAERCDLFLVPRHNYVMGRYVRAWGPDHLTRLFHRVRCSWGDHVLHDTRHASSPERVQKLRGWLEHKRHSRGAFSDYFDGKLEDGRLVQVARQMYQQGRRCRPSDIWLRPAVTFLKFYFVKGACLDGLFGLMIAQKAARGTQLKYAALWSVQQGIESIHVGEQQLAR